MRHLLPALFALTLTAAAFGQTAQPKFKKVVLSDKFYAEGACIGDINKDGKPDLVAGPWWFEGPDFTKKHVYCEVVKSYDPKGYSENFLTFVGDFDGDGNLDILPAPWPGKEGYWYQNPGPAGWAKDEPWKKHLIHKAIDNESPVLVDFFKDGKRQLLCNAEGKFVLLTPDPAKPTAPWTLIPLTPKGDYQRYTHGVGMGDINGDGKMDLLEQDGWWEQPANWKPGEVFVKHPFKFAAGAAQMHAYDIDGDGKADVINSWHCHEYGLLWWKQGKNDKGEISFTKQVILPENPDVKSADLRISQLHAQILADMNGDGVPDLVTGKRFWSHGPKGDKEPDAPAVVYWFETKRDGKGGATFVPHQIDDDSGVGTQVEAGDVNGDGVPDVVVANKKGIFVHLSQK